MHHHLILSRRPGEKIVVDFTALQIPNTNLDTSDTNLIICARSTSPQQMKLDFYAPETIKIWRQEIWRRLP